MMEVPALTAEMITVFAILGMVIILLVFDVLRVDVIGLLVMTLLPLTGILTPGEATAGLGSKAVIVLICVMVIGAALHKTGVVDIIAQKILKIAGNSQSRIASLLMVAVAIPSGFMSNVGAVAMMLPATLQLSKKAKIPASKLVMPLGFCAMIGGNLTLIGTSALVILNDIMEKWWNANAPASGESFTPLGLFSIAPIGIALLIGAMAYFLLIGRRLLPSQDLDAEDKIGSTKLRALYEREVGEGIEFVVPDDFSAQTLGQLDLRAKHQASVVAVAKNQGQHRIFAPLKTTAIEPGDVLLAACNEDAIQNVVADLGWQPRDEIKTFIEEDSPENVGIVEGIVTARSSLNGHTMGELKLKTLFMINPLAVMRENEIHIKLLDDLVLKPGDMVLLHGEWEHLRLLQENTELIYTESLPAEEGQEDARKGKAWLALLALASFLTLALAVKLPTPVAGLVALIILVFGKVLHIDEVYRAIDWKTIFLIAGLIPLGLAFEKTGAANYVALNLLQQISGLDALLLYLILAVLTSFFGMFVSNVGTTVLLVPLAMNIAGQIGADPIMAGLIVAMCSTNTFMLPTHQVSAMIMQPGGYKTTDYLRVGSGVMVLFIVILMTMITLFYGP